VATITEDTVRALAAVRGTQAPVTTCYLDVDGRHFTTRGDVQREFASLVKRAGVDGRANPSVTKDVERMARHVRATSGAALGASPCSRARPTASGRCTSCPVSSPHNCSWASPPSVHQLEDLIDKFVRLAVLLTDRQRARVLVYEQGQVVGERDVVDPLERQGEDARGELVKTRVSSQRQQQARQHVRHAAQQAFAALRDVPVEHIVVGAPTPDVLSDFEQALHPYLRERVAARIVVPIGARQLGSTRSWASSKRRSSAATSWRWPLSCAVPSAARPAAWAGWR